MKDAQRKLVSELRPSDSISIGGAVYTIFTVIPAPAESPDDGVYLHLRSSGVYSSDTAIRLQSFLIVEYFAA